MEKIESLSEFVDFGSRKSESWGMRKRVEAFCRRKLIAVESGIKKWPFWGGGGCAGAGCAEKCRESVHLFEFSAFLMVNGSGCAGEIGRAHV